MVFVTYWIANASRLLMAERSRRSDRRSLLRFLSRAQSTEHVSVKTNIQHSTPIRLQFDRVTIRRPTLRP